MDDYDNQKGAKPDDVRAALRGWPFFAEVAAWILGV